MSLDYYTDPHEAARVRRKYKNRKNVLARRNRLVGRRFGLLTVIERYAGEHWHCRCDCGGETFVDGWTLEHGKAKSCGCQRYNAEHRAKMSAAAKLREQRKREART